VAAKRPRDWPWVVALLLLAAVVGETVASDSTPPIRYLVPTTLPFLVLGYGCWALLFREAWVRRRLSWPGAILAGIGYTAFNEGLIAQTWFRANLNGFSAFRLGRLAGVNWCIVVGLCVYHSIFSMAMPIALVQIRRGEVPPRPWVGRRGIRIAGGLILLVILGTLDNHAVDHSSRRLIAAGLAILLPLLAYTVSRAGLRRKLGDRDARDPALANHAGAVADAQRTNHRSVRRRGAYVAGLAWATAFYLAYYAVPALIGLPAVAVELLVAGVGGAYLATRPRRPEWSSAHWVALIAGALTPAMCFDVFQIGTLETLAVVTSVVALIRLSLRVAPSHTVDLQPDELSR
jgi:hypothetical protein